MVVFWGEKEGLVALPLVAVVAAVANRLYVTQRSLPVPGADLSRLGTPHHAMPHVNVITFRPDFPESQMPLKIAIA